MKSIGREIAKKKRLNQVYSLAKQCTDYRLQIYCNKFIKKNQIRRVTNAICQCNVNVAIQ